MNFDIKSFNLWFAMFIVSFIAILNFIGILFLTGVILDFLGISKLLNSLSIFLSTNNDASEIVANNYFLIIMVIFPLSYFSFVLVLKLLSKIEKIEKALAFYNSNKKTSIAYYTVVLVFFGFLPLFLNTLALKPPELQKLNNIFFLVSLSSIFPYFSLLITEAKEIKSRNNFREDNFELKEKKETKKKYDNIYFVLAIIFLMFIFVLLFFMYQQNFNWNMENLSIVISTLGILGTFTAASAAAWAARTAKNLLLEQSAANERAVKPYLVVLNKSYEVTIPSTQHPFLFNWDNGVKIKSSSKFENQSFLQFSNISSGIAKKVIVKIKIKDYMPLVDKVNKLQNDPFKFIEIKNNNSEDGSPVLEVFSRIQNRKMSFNENKVFNLKETIETYVAIGIKNNEEVSIKIPQIFIILNNIYMSTKFKMHDVIHLPYLEISISCESIQKKQYDFKYLVYLDALNSTENILSGNKNFQFNIKVSEY